MVILGVLELWQLSVGMRDKCDEVGTHMVLA